MSSTPVTRYWVVCPVCRKASVSGNRYCEHCWGAVVHPDIEITEEEEEEVRRLRNAYLKHRRRVKIASYGVGSLAIVVTIYLGLYFLTDTVYIPPQDLDSASNPGEWSMFGYDLGHSGNVESDDAVPQGVLKWAFPTDGSVHSSPAVVNDTVYFGSRDHKLYAVDTDTGAEKWTYETGSWVESSPAVTNSTVYFGSNDSNFYALNTENGEKIWDFETVFAVMSSPSIAGDVVYFGSDDYYIYALDRIYGKKIWDFNTGSPAKSSPVISAGILYTGSGGSGYSFAIDAESGRRRLRFRSHYSVYGTPAVDEGTVYFINTNGMIYAVDGRARTWLREHEIKPFWTQMFLMGIPGIPEPPQQSGLQWSLQLEEASHASPVIIRDTLYAATGNKLVAIDLDTKEIRWEFETGDLIRSTPSVAGNTVFFGSDDGRMYALDTTSGEKLWDFSTGGKVSSSPAIVNGVLYFGSYDGNLYALE